MQLHVVVVAQPLQKPHHLSIHQFPDLKRRIDVIETKLLGIGLPIFACQGIKELRLGHCPGHRDHWS